MSQPPIKSEQLKVGVTTGDLIEVLGSGFISSSIIPNVAIPPTNNYTFGGSYASGATFRSTEISKWDGVNSTQESATLEYPVNNHSVARITPLAATYIFGGVGDVSNGNTLHDTIQKYDGTTRSTEAATLQAIWYFGSASELSNMSAAYAFGGYDGATSVAIQKYDGTTRSLETETVSHTHQDGDHSDELPSLNAAYIIAGNNGVTFGSTTIDKFDGTTASTETETLVTNISRTSVTKLEPLSAIYILGGGDTGPIEYNTIQKWDGSTRTTESATLQATWMWATASQQLQLSADYMFAGYNGNINAADPNTIQKWDGSTRTTEGTSYALNIWLTRSSEL